MTEYLTPAELRALRERLGLSQGELAKRLGIDRNSVWRKEHGQRAITERDCIMLRQIEKDGAELTPEQAARLTRE